MLSGFTASRGVLSAYHCAAQELLSPELSCQHNQPSYTNKDRLPTTLLAGQAGEHAFRSRVGRLGRAGHRVAGAVLCKVRCDRKFPCANCVRHQVECEPALAPRRRRRRFPERELLSRVRRYEDTLRHHHIPFEALHLSDLWNAINRGQLPHAQDDTHSAGHDSDSGDYELGNAWDRTYHDENHDEFLFGAASSRANSDLSALHPEQMHIIRLWQVYLDNVNPLLRVTHSPTLQARILDAVGDLAAVTPELEALIFSIYCVSILSLAGDECLRLFGSPKNQLLTSPLARGYAWFVRLHFPMLAYVHVLRYLKRGRFPLGEGASSRREAWRVLGESYAAHAAEPKLADAILVVCSRLVLQAWEARGADSAGPQQQGEEEVPRIVSDMRDKAALGPREGGPGQPAAPGPVGWGCEDAVGLQGLPGSQSDDYYDPSPWVYLVLRPASSGIHLTGNLWVYRISKLDRVGKGDRGKPYSRQQSL